MAGSARWTDRDLQHDSILESPATLAVEQAGRYGDCVSVLGLHLVCLHMESVALESEVLRWGYLVNLAGSIRHQFAWELFLSKTSPCLISPHGEANGR